MLVETDSTYMDQAADFFAKNPNYFALMFLLLGVVIMWGSIKKWGWLFEGGDGLFNIVWVAENFGMRTAQILIFLFGLCFAGAGVAWLYFG